MRDGIIDSQSSKYAKKENAMPYYVCDNPTCVRFGIRSVEATCTTCTRATTLMTDESDDSAPPHGSEIRLFFDADRESWLGTLVYVDPDTCVLGTIEAEQSSAATCADELLRLFQEREGGK